MDLWLAFILGLAGSLHCAGMCGPLALALPPSGNGAFAFLLGRVACNLGRIVTYCFFGIIFGLLGKTLWLAGFQRWVSIALGLALIAGFFMHGNHRLFNPFLKLLNKLRSRMATLLRHRSLLALAMLGLLNGLLPCGLVYVACAGATATGGILAGAQYMAAFGAGTLPMMLVIGFSGKLVSPSFRLHFRKAVPISVFLLAALLILRGMSLGIPYVSPALSTGFGAKPCCHK